MQVEQLLESELPVELLMQSPSVVTLTHVSAREVSDWIFDRSSVEQSPDGELLASARAAMTAPLVAKQT